MLTRICLTSAGVGVGPAVGRPVGLDDQRRGAGDERRRLARAAGLLDVGGLAQEVDAAGEGRAGVAGGEAEVAGGDQVDGGAGLVNPPELSELMLLFSQPVVAK